MSPEKPQNSLENTSHRGHIALYRSAMKEKVGYISDVLFNTLYHRKGFTSPRVYRGYFADTEYGKTQERLFQELLKNGFKRELFQIIFPGQTAGIVKKLEEVDGFDEAHIRFYKDGAIDIELEQGRFGKDHWNGDRKFAGEYLIELIQQLEIPEGDKCFIKNHLLQSKEMHKMCERNIENEHFLASMLYTMLFLWEYVFGTAVFVLLLAMINQSQ